MGLLRIILALSVVAGHSQSTILGFNGLGATYAVSVFFVVSGFYMALILNEKYSTLPTKYFYLSRALRIYPIYIIGLAFSLIVSFTDIRGVFESLTIISKTYMLISNSFIFGRDIVNQFCWNNLQGVCTNPLSMSINPPGWSLAPELIFYLAAPFIVKSKKNVILVWLIGCVYFWVISQLKYPINRMGMHTSREVTFNYTFYPASIIYFMTGVLGYHFIYLRDRISYPLCLMMLLALSFTITPLASWVILLLGLGIPVIFTLTKDIKIDRFMGELSYPVYILHFPVFLYVKKNGFVLPSFTLGTTVSLITLLISIIIHFIIDKKIAEFRHSNTFTNHTHKIKSQSKHLPTLVMILYGLAPVAWVGYLSLVAN
ncbi:acyltransferase [Pantoea sp.]|uniref:acyltransferase family protein n=1 Tax=Pantoea sp. TaxID=69393 RepID=UPI0028B05AE3|nr:acyltransferase [Pantoea sp.]